MEDQGKILFSQLFSREQIDKMYELLQKNDNAQYIWVRVEENLSGIGPDIFAEVVKDINSEVLQEEDITDPGTW